MTLTPPDNRDPVLRISDERLIRWIEHYEDQDEQIADALKELRALRTALTASGDALREAVTTIENYLAYEHDGDPWAEDAIDKYARDGRLERARSILAKVR